jgi:hypothetical protein
MNEILDKLFEMNMRLISISSKIDSMQEDLDTLTATEV